MRRSADMSPLPHHNLVEAAGDVGDLLLGEVGNTGSDKISSAACSATGRRPLANLR